MLLALVAAILSGCAGSSDGPGASPRTSERVDPAEAGDYRSDPRVCVVSTQDEEVWLAAYSARVRADCRELAARYLEGETNLRWRSPPSARESPSVECAVKRGAGFVQVFESARTTGRVDPAEICDRLRTDGWKRARIRVFATG
jgi:hypothetical protein